MFECTECSTRISLQNPEEGLIIDCPGCGTEMEFTGNQLIGLHLGPSEE